MILRRYKWWFVGIVILLLANILLWQVIWKLENGILTVAYLDVGQGDSIYIEAPNGNQMLVDGGPPSGKVLSSLGSVMPFYDRSIDLVLATHPDADHIGGLPEVLERFSVGAVMEPGVTSDTNVYRTFEERIREKEVQKIIAKRGQRIWLDKSTYFDILYPDRDVSGYTKKTNDASVIGRLVYGESEFLLTGDAPISVERLLLMRPKEIDSDVLKVGHHGSRTSTSAEFLSAVSPDIAAISFGKDNRYGHPHQDVVERLESNKVVVLNTLNGTVVIQSDGKTIWRE